MSTPEDESWIMPTAEAPEPRKRRVGLVVIPVLALVLLCCGGGWAIRSAITGHKSDKSGPLLIEPVTVPPATAQPAPEPSTTGPTTSKPPTTKLTTKPATKPTTRSAASRRATTRPTTSKPATGKPTPAPTATGVVQHNVRQGALCSPLGAIGTTSNGRLERCGPTIDDPRDRWRRVAG